MPKKEEKKKDEETAVGGSEFQTPKTETSPNKEAEITNPISELSEPKTPETAESPEKTTTEIAMNPISATEETNTTPPMDSESTTTTTPALETLPIDQVTSEKAVQETYPLADEIEKDAMKKKSLFSSLLIFRNKKGKIVLLILGVLLIIGLAIGTVMNANNEKLSFMKMKTKTRETVVLSPTAAPSPSPTPVAVEKSSLSIQIQNGSGKSGVAGKMKDLLVEKGYTGSIDTGNADNYDYENTIVKIKPTKSAAESELRKDLSENYTLSEDQEKLEDSSEYDVIIIIGAE